MSVKIPAKLGHDNKSYCILKHKAFDRFKFIGRLTHPISVLLYSFKEVVRCKVATIFKVTLRNLAHVQVRVKTNVERISMKCFYSKY